MTSRLTSRHSVAGRCSSLRLTTTSRVVIQPLLISHIDFLITAQLIISTRVVSGFVPT